MRQRKETESRLFCRFASPKPAKSDRARDTGEQRDDASFATRRRPSSTPTAPAPSSSSPVPSSLAAALLAPLSSLLLFLAPPVASASLLELPASKLQNTYWLVRAGESVSEADGRVDTNRATKQGTGAGLSELGKRQVAEGALPMAAREACGGGCFVYYGTVRRSEQIAAAIGAAAGLSQSRLIPEFSFLDPRGLGALEGGQLAAVTDEVSAGDASSPLYRPPMGTTGTPNESLGDVLMRVTQLVSAEVSERMRARERERGFFFFVPWSLSFSSSSSPPPPPSICATSASRIKKYSKTQKLKNSSTLFSSTKTIKQETKHRGEDVVIVFPDAALPGAFQAAVLGEDLRAAESLAPPPGGMAKLRLAPWSSSPMTRREQEGG